LGEGFHTLTKASTFLSTASATKCCLNGQNLGEFISLIGDWRLRISRRFPPSSGNMVQ